MPQGQYGAINMTLGIQQDVMIRTLTVVGGSSMTGIFLQGNKKESKGIAACATSKTGLLQISRSPVAVLGKQVKQKSRMPLDRTKQRPLLKYERSGAGLSKVLTLKIGSVGPSAPGVPGG